MLQIRLKLTSNRDGEVNNPENGIPQSDDEILRALSCFCKIQSALSYDKIIRLYERVKSTSDCLVDYDIEDDSVSSSPAAPTLYPTSDTCGSSSTSQYINPSLLTLDKDARDHSTRTSFLTPSSDRSHSPLLPSTREPLNKSPSSELSREASGAFREQDLPDAATTPGNNFDSAFREFEEMGLLGHSSDVRLGPCDRTNSLDPSTRFPLGGNEGPPSETVDVSKNGSSTGQLRTPAPIFDCGEGVGQDPSPRLAPNTPAGDSHELRGIDTANIEEDAHRESPDATPYYNCPQTPRTSCASSGWSPGASYFTPDTSTVATPTTTMLQQSSAEATEGNQTSKRCSSERRSLSYQPTAEDAPDERERNAEVLSDDSNEFGDLSIKAVLDDAPGFLRDTSGDHESSSSSITNAAGADPDTNSPAIASCRLESDNQHALLINGKGDRTQTSSGSESRKISRKRKLSSTVESQAALPTPNRRSRLRNGVNQTALVIPNLEKDRWDGRFSGHSLLSTLLPDQKDEIERKSKQILRSDLAEFMEKHTKIWKSTGFWSSPSLDAPNSTNTSADGKGHAIWRYVEAMQAEGETHYLKSRFADIRLFLASIEEFNRQKKAGHPDQTAKIRAINVICGTASLPKATAKKIRASFHEHKLVGERWWWSGCYLGLGFILLCSEETGKKVRSKSFKLDPFILYILHNCRSILACCSKFDEAVDTLLADGRFPKQISKKEVQQWIKNAKAINQESIPIIHWQAWSTDAVASKASDFLSARSSNRS